MTAEIYFLPTGEIRYIHTDLAATLTLPLGVPIVRRASHVEPDRQGQWWVDLSPVAGPRLGPFPPDGRQAALAAEAAWIKRNHLLRQTVRDETLHAEAPKRPRWQSCSWNRLWTWLMNLRKSRSRRP